MKVWITYAFEDKEFVEKLKSFLRKANLEVLDVENEIMPGDNIIETIYRAISESDIIFVILSKSGGGRQWFSTEIGMIISEIRNNRQKKIIPILKDKDAEIPAFINQYQCLDASDPKSLNSQFDKLLSILNAKKESHIGDKELVQKANEMFLSRDFLLQKEKLEYEKQRNHKQKQITLVFLTTLFTTLAGILVFFISTNELFHIENAIITTPFIALLFGVLIGLAVNIILNQLKKK
jgi:hypothetical protein